MWPPLMPCCARRTFRISSSRCRKGCFFTMVRETRKDNAVRLFCGWIFLCVAGVMWAEHSYGQDRSQTRSMVISRNGIVAAESPLAAEAGVRILEQGGNAVDAAIATNAMMGVVEPMMNRSEEHTSELQSPDTISYAVFCLK